MSDENAAQPFAGQRVALCSYRLGGTDGVSIEAAKWQWALEQLGFTVHRVASEIEDHHPGDRIVPWITTLDSLPIDIDGLAALFAEHDLVVITQIGSLPLQPSVSRAVLEALRRSGVPSIQHHHDLPWERTETAYLTSQFPIAVPRSTHVVINDAARAELAARGLPTVLLRNTFDCAAIPGNRVGTRALFGLRNDEVVVLHPARAIERKNIPAGLSFAADLQTYLDRPVRYWLTGPAEDGYDLDAVLRDAPVAVTVGRTFDVQDAYAAADVVVFPSLSEGFGNPIIEATLAGKPVAVSEFPVLVELEALGLRLLSTAEPDQVAAVITAGGDEHRARNRAVIEEQLNRATLPAQLQHLIEFVSANA